MKVSDHLCLDSLTSQPLISVPTENEKPIKVFICQSILLEHSSKHIQVFQNQDVMFTRATHNQDTHKHAWKPVQYDG